MSCFTDVSFPVTVSASVVRACSECSNACILRKTVAFAQLDDQDFTRIHRFIERQEFAKGDVLYSEGRVAKGIIVLRGGMVKLVRNTRDGRERIVRVLRSCDITGLEALATAQYDSDAVALTAVTVCRIPLDTIKDLLVNNPHFLGELMKKWQQALKDAGDWLTELNSGTARQRISHLIIKMCDPDNSEISTLLSLEDMGSMVDLKIETVSREVSRLVRIGALAPVDKHRRIFRICKPKQFECY